MYDFEPEQKYYHPSSMLYDADRKLEMLLSFVSQRYQAYTERRNDFSNNFFSQDSFSEEADLDQLDKHMKKFGQVVWSFADTSSRLDASSIQLHHFSSFDDLPQWIEPSSSNSPQNRTEWEGIWQNLFGSVQLDLAVWSNSESCKFQNKSFVN